MEVARLDRLRRVLLELGAFVDLEPPGAALERRRLCFLEDALVEALDAELVLAVLAIEVSSFLQTWPTSHDEMNNFIKFLQSQLQLGHFVLPRFDDFH